MDIRKIGIAVMLLGISFALGRSSVKQIETSESSKTDTSKNTTTNTDSHSVTVIETDPNGKTRTTTTTDTKTKEKEIEKTKIIEQAQTLIAPYKSRLNISVLAGLNARKLNEPVLYGLHVSKDVMGPISVGAYGLTNGVVGLSLGVSF